MHDRPQCSTQGPSINGIIEVFYLSEHKTTLKSLKEVHNKEANRTNVKSAFLRAHIQLINCIEAVECLNSIDKKELKKLFTETLDSI